MLLASILFIFNPLIIASSNVNLGIPKSNNPVMTKQAMFRLFDIPVETQQFYNDMLKRRIESPDTPSNHIDNCFRQVNRFVDYDEELHKFINVDYATHRWRVVLDETQETFSRSAETGSEEFNYQFLKRDYIVG